MTHIKTILAKTIANASKAKLYHQNKDIFLKYFDSVEQYEALISAGNFKKIDEIIKQNSSFNLDEFLLTLKTKIMKLHLVEPKTGKRLKLGEDFGYYGKWINCFEDGRFEVDEKDPLGDDPMFNGRTYGNGRFILCEGEA